VVFSTNLWESVEETEKSIESLRKIHVVKQGDQQPPIGRSAYLSGGILCARHGTLLGGTERSIKRCREKRCLGWGVLLGRVGTSMLLSREHA